MERGRSTFVTVVAAVFGGLALVGLMGTLGQLLMFASMQGLFTDFGVTGAIFAMPIAAGLYELLELVVSVQLYRRRGWARSVFIWLRMFNVVMCGLGMLAIVVIYVWTLAEGGSFGPGEAIIVLVLMVFVAASASVQVWVVRRLKRPEIVREFGARADTA